MTVTESWPLVLVIVPVYEMGPRLSRLLSCLEAQSYPAERFECLLVDNHPQPKLQRPVGTSFRLKLLHEPRPGSYAGRNRGVATASGQILAFTDADCGPLLNWLQQAVSAWIEHEGEAIMGGRVSIESEQPSRWNGWFWYSMVNDLRQDMFVRQYGFVATANLIFSSDVFARVGELTASLYSAGDLE